MDDYGKGPTTLRTMRSVAIAKGTNPAGFPRHVPFHPQGGHALGQNYGGGSYADASKDAGTGAGPLKGQPSPFKLGAAPVRNRDNDLKGK